MSINAIIILVDQNSANFILNIYIQRIDCCPLKHSMYFKSVGIMILAVMAQGYRIGFNVCLRHFAFRNESWSTRYFHLFVCLLSCYNYGLIEIALPLKGRSTRTQVEDGTHCCKVWMKIVSRLLVWYYCVFVI